MKVAFALTGALVISVVIAGLAAPLGGGPPDGLMGRDCRLMAQALTQADPQLRVIASDRKCDWKTLVAPSAIAHDDLPPHTSSPSMTVNSPIYSLWRYRAEVDVGVQWAPLAGEGELCTYYRFWGAWHLSGCRPFWVS